MDGEGPGQSPADQGPAHVEKRATDAFPLQIKGQTPGVKISPLYEALLVSAHGLWERAKQPNAAVLVAQTAIEVCTQRLITKLLDQRGGKFLEDWIGERLQNYNIRNEMVRKLYEAVSSDTQFVKQPFWTSHRLENHVELRNDIAHEGRSVTNVEAQASITVAREVISYLLAIAALHGIDLGDKPKEASQ